ncbi:HAD family hydrolase [Ancylobacter sp. G4_0304]|uniref:HAD family hydrolase n=1 Tax=Ancylobacter sp. G4_0304 TaxID=3114289 RepID=UPI0039C61339
MATSPSPIRLVIFDMDDVLLHYDVHARQSAIALMAGLAPEEVARRIWDSGLEDAADAGRLSAQAYLDAVAETLGVPFGEDDWLRTRALAMTLTPDTIGLASAVARGTPVALLTNNGHLMKTYFDTLVPELRAVFGTNMHVAAEFGTKKPDPAIYRRLAALYGAAPEQAVMIDDKEVNAAGAREAGLYAHRFRAAPELDAYLRSLSLI